MRPRSLVTGKREGETDRQTDRDKEAVFCSGIHDVLQRRGDAENKVRKTTHGQRRASITIHIEMIPLSRHKPHRQMVMVTAFVDSDERSKASFQLYYIITNLVSS